MNPDLDTLVTALYVTVDDLLVAHPGWAPPRPAVGFAPKLSDAELLTLFEEQLCAAGITLIRPATKSEPPRAGGRFLRPIRQIIESIFQTLKAQLGLERHGGRTPAGVAVRVLQRLLALTAAIRHNQTTPRAGPARSPLAYDH